jgi:hypothetical protein
VARIKAGGVQIVMLKSPYIHAKAVVEDGSTVYLGSENISATSLDKNREMGLILTDPTVISAVEQAFASDFGGAPSPVSQRPAGPTTTPTPTTASSSQSGAFTVQASVTPTPVRSSSQATVTATTTAGASCTAHVVYSTGSVPSSFHGTAHTVPASGSVSWSWRVSTNGSGGTAAVSCMLGGKAASATAAFTVTH